MLALGPSQGPWTLACTDLENLSDSLQSCPCLTSTSIAETIPASSDSSEKKNKAPLQDSHNYHQQWQIDF